MIEVRGISQVVAETRRKMEACFATPPRRIPARRKSAIRGIDAGEG